MVEVLDPVRTAVVVPVEVVRRPGPGLGAVVGPVVVGVGGSVPSPRSIEKGTPSRSVSVMVLPLSVWAPGGATQDRSRPDGSGIPDIGAPTDEGAISRC